MAYQDVIFREYDIRGVYREQYDLDFCYTLGQVYTKYVSSKIQKEKLQFAVGNDARNSCPEIVEALTRGMADAGANVYLLGLVTSPMTYFCSFNGPKVDGSIMVTGSHNPPEYNGFKVSLGKSTLFGTEIQNLLSLVKSYVPSHSSQKGKIEPYDIKPTYVDRYKEEFKNVQDIPFVLDCGNGAAGAIVRRLCDSIGLKPLILFEQPDGKFPNHHPDPTVEKNLVALKQAVIESKSMVGIGFDGDADRIGVVDADGSFVYGDELIAFFARFVSEVRPNEPIVGDVKCSDRLYAYIKKYNGKPIMWKTGHSPIKEKIKSEKAPFGGEMSGHVFFADRNYGYDDAVYAGLRLVEILSREKKTLRQLLSDYPTAFSTPEIRIDTTEEIKLKIVETLKNVLPKDPLVKEIELLDGIRVRYADGWALARASNTQPVIVLRYEATTKAGLDRIQSNIEKIVTPMLRQ